MQPFLYRVEILILEKNEGLSKPKHTHQLLVCLCVLLVDFLFFGKGWLKRFHVEGKVH